MHNVGMMPTQISDFSASNEKNIYITLFISHYIPYSGHFVWVLLHLF